MEVICCRENNPFLNVYFKATNAVPCFLQKPNISMLYLSMFSHRQYSVLLFLLVSKSSSSTVLIPYIVSLKYHSSIP